MADRQPRVRCRGKEILTEGRRNMGSTKAGKKNRGRGGGVSHRKGGAAVSLGLGTQETWLHHQLAV